MTDGLPSMLQPALELARAGFAVFPCAPSEKKPLVSGGFKSATRNETQIAAWWTRNPVANIGIATGAASGVLVIDLDSELGRSILNRMEAKYGALPPTVSATTGKGAHLYYRLPANCGRVPPSQGDGIDIRADDSYVVAPPSMHPNGTQYRWSENAQTIAVAPDWLVMFAQGRERVLLDVLGPELAQRLRTLRGKPDAAALEGMVAAINSGPLAGKAAIAPSPMSLPAASTPGRSSLTSDLLNTQAPTSFSEAEARRLISALAFLPSHNWTEWLQVGMVLHDLDAADSRWNGRTVWDRWSQGSDKFDPVIQERNWQSFGRPRDGARVGVGTVFHLARAAGWIDPESPLAQAGEAMPQVTPKADVDPSRFYFTDAGNALQFVALYGEDVRYVEQERAWLVWNGHSWSRISETAILPMARGVTEHILKWATGLPTNDERRANLFRHALASQKEARLRSMLHLAQGERTIRVDPDQLDRNPLLLGCPNGTLDLRTGKIRAALREDYITKACAASFNPDSSCPNWLGFLETFTGGDVRLIAYLQRMAGYILTGDVSEEVLFFPWGPGNNGKSVFIETLAAVMGDYAIASGSGLLITSRDPGAASPELVRLKGARLVTINETQEGDHLNEGRVKFITSNTKLSARSLYGSPFDFSPTHKAVVASNYRPVIKGADLGIWRRIHLIPCNASISESGKIPDFRERKLTPEMSGILLWMTEGCLAWQRDRLSPPSAVTAATRDYRDDMDLIGRWLAEHCVTGSFHLTPYSILWAHFKFWAEGEGSRAYTSRWFGNQLTNRGFGRRAGGKGAAMVTGLGLASRVSQLRLVGENLGA